VARMASAGTASIEAQVDELWGSSKDEAWKREEVRRIKRERGIQDTEDPPAGDE